MKKVLLLFVSALTLGMICISCSDDDSSSSPSQASVEGKWNHNKISITSNGTTSPEENYYDNEPGCAKDYIEFKTGGIINGGDYIDVSCTLDLSTGSWTKTGNMITVTIDGEVVTIEVISVSSSELKLKLYDLGSTDIVNMSFTKA